MSIDSVRYASRTAENASRLACMSLKIPRRIGSVHPRAIGPRPPVFLRAAGTCAFVRLRGQAFEHTPIAAMAEQRKETDDVSGAARAKRRPSLSVAPPWRRWAYARTLGLASARMHTSPQRGETLAAWGLSL